jgi:hypothetical protein
MAGTGPNQQGLALRGMCRGSGQTDHPPARPACGVVATGADRKSGAGHAALPAGRSLSRRSSACSGTKADDEFPFERRIRRNPIRATVATAPALGPGR